MKAVAQRYAAALADVALEQGAAEPLRKNLADFAESLASSPDLASFLASPAAPRPSKQAVIEELAARSGAGKIFRNFLLVLTENRRTALLPAITQAFEALLLERMGIAEARVVSAAEPEEAQKAQLERALQQLTGREVRVHYIVDPTLLGGAVVRIGSTVYDGSVRAQLETLRERLALV